LAQLVDPKLSEASGGRKNRLLSSLQVYAPIAATAKDMRGWGSKSGLYSSTQSYSLYGEVPNVPPNLVVWKHIWHFKSLPKIDIFVWTLTRGSILSGENLEKKKASQASIGALYVTLIKTLQRIFSTIHSSRGCSSRGHSSRGHSSKGRSSRGHNSSSTGHSSIGSSRGHSSRGHNSIGHSSTSHSSRGCSSRGHSS
jgi:hypothetical protein